MPKREIEPQEIAQQTKDAIYKLMLRADVERTGKVSTTDVYLIVKDDPIAFAIFADILNTNDAYISANSVMMLIN